MTSSTTQEITTTVHPDYEKEFHKRIRINNYVSEQEELVRLYRQALLEIEWLEKEVLRLKLLLEEKDIINNSLSTPKP